MKGIYFSLSKIEKECPETYGLSKLLGTPIFPQGFLLDEDGESLLTDSDYFVAQINLSDIKDMNASLPEKGMLYFFVDVDTLEAKVLFADSLDCDALEVYDDINDCFTDELGLKDGYSLVFDAELEEGHFILGDINPDIDLDTDIDTDGYVTLLELDFLSLPHENMLRFGELAVSDGRYIFLIKEDDLKKLDFSSVICIDKED